MAKLKTGEQSIAFALKSLNNQIKRLFERSAIMENDANLTGSQYAVLAYLDQQPEDMDIYQKDIEGEFNIRRSTASGMLKLLEQQGYIRRVNDTVDTRLKKITTTEKADELGKIAKKNMSLIQERLTKGISPEEMDQFFATLKKISDNAQI